jgi:hypothetical protein
MLSERLIFNYIFFTKNPLPLKGQKLAVMIQKTENKGVAFRYAGFYKTVRLEKYEP